MTFTLAGIIAGAGIGAYIGTKIDSHVEESLTDKEKRRIKKAFEKLGVEIPDLEDGETNESEVHEAVERASGLSEEKKEELGREIDEILS